MRNLGRDRGSSWIVAIGAIVDERNASDRPERSAFSLIVTIGLRRFDVECWEFGPVFLKGLDDKKRVLMSSLIAYMKAIEILLYN